MGLFVLFPSANKQIFNFTVLPPWHWDSLDLLSYSPVNANFDLKLFCLRWYNPNNRVFYPLVFPSLSILCFPMLYFAWLKCLLKFMLMNTSWFVNVYKAFLFAIILESSSWVGAHKVKSCGNFSIGLTFYTFFEGD